VESLDCVVVGAGVVGLAVARRLALAGREVVVLEAEAGIGHHTSSRNSEVIHAGLYYPTGSLKARLCVAGRLALYSYLVERSIPHRRIGKILVAVSESEIATLERIARLAESNGVTDLVPLSASDVRAFEPSVRAIRGVLSPQTGIVDSHALMSALRADLEAQRGTVVLRAPVVGGRPAQGGLELDVGGPDPLRVRCNLVVNSAGLFAPQLARRLVDPDLIPIERYAKGHYFTLNGPSPFERLVYPMPSPGALGIHVTLDLAGRVRFGPDISWTDTLDYTFDERRAPSFYQAVRRFYPDLPEGALSPGYVGVRPKIVAEGAPAADFVLQGADVHGVPGLVNLLGIESPGLTACLAIAEEVHGMLRAE
jgi:L-2-hydroxyglutarate oxidase LhgO